MKRHHQILLAVVGLGIGYALGNVSRESRSLATSSSVPEGSREEEVNSPTVAGEKDEAVAQTAAALLARKDIRELASIHTLLEKLDSEQLRALMDRVNAMAQSERRVLLPRVLAYWTRRDPEGATEWMLPHLARYAKQDLFASGFADFGTDFVGAWSANAPDRAFEVARQFAGTGLGGMVLHSAILRWPGGDSKAAFDALMTYPPGKDRQKVLSSLCFSWAQEDRDSALAAVSTLPPGAERDGALGELLAHLALRDPAAAFTQAAAHALTNPSWLAVLVKEAAKKEPVTAVRWLETQEPELLLRLGPLAVQFWAGQDPAGAFAWAQAHGISITDRRAGYRSLSSEGGTWMHSLEVSGESPFGQAMRQQPDATIAWVRALPAGPERERYLAAAIGASPQIEKVKPLLQELSEDAANRAAAWITTRLGFSAPDQAREWAESLPAGPQREAAWTAFGATRTEPLDIPPGPDRDAMLIGIAVTQSRQDPIKALERATEIEDIALRRRTFDDVRWGVTRGTIDYGDGGYSPGITDSELRKVRDWLNTSEIPEDWKRAWTLGGL